MEAKRASNPLITGGCEPPYDSESQVNADPLQE